jgi:hypothetical protein
MICDRMVMTVTLDLKPELKALVAERTTAQGLTVEDYIQNDLTSRSR